MAKIGMKKPIAALLGQTAGSYSLGKEIGGAISANISIDTYGAKLYSNDALCEEVAGFKSGSLALNVDELSQEVQVFLLGHKESDVTVGGTQLKEMAAKGGDISPYVGFGFYATKMVGNVKKYRAIWFLKVKFSEPNDENETAGEEIQFKIPTINGTISVDDSGKWKIETTTDDEEKAIEWLKTKANIT